MLFFAYFVCALLEVDSLRGGLAEGNGICSASRHSHSQSPCRGCKIKARHSYKGEIATSPPILAFLGLFAYPTLPYPIVS